jgi:Holliday junction resolvasome RuvABC DNA-binding subunit
LGDVIDALVTLGYSVLQARETAKKLNPEGKTSEQLLREALRSIK